MRLALATDADVPAEVIAGVRPEHARLWDTEPGLIGPIEGSVDYVEALGREWFAGVEFDEGSSFIVRGSSNPIPEIESRVTFGFRPGGVVPLRPGRARLCLFRPEGGREVPGRAAARPRGASREVG